MAQAVLMPKQGITVESCVITAWHKQVGDDVKKGDMLFTYETDKSSFDVEAEAEGKLLEVFWPEGEDIPVLAAVAAIGELGEDITALRPDGAGMGRVEEPAQAPTQALAPAETAQPAQMPAEAVQAPAEAASASGVVSPRARRVAGELGIDAAAAHGTGPDGRVIERDVRALFAERTARDVPAQAAEGTQATSAQPVAEPQPATPAREGGAWREERLSSVRRAIARGMTASLQTMAQLTLSSSFDATDILRQRAAFKASKDAGIAGITLTDMVHFAVARALATPAHAALNAHLNGETMRYFADVNLAFAVDTPRGLLVPTIFGAQRMTLRQISATAKELAGMSQTGAVPPDLLGGATFTVSNLGGLGIEHFTPVINPPQTGILGVNNITYRPRSAQGDFYPAMGLSITFDHRALDGADAARFLKTVGSSLENFAELLAG